MRVREEGGYTGLDLGRSAQIDLDYEVSGFEIMAATFLEPGVVEVFDLQGRLIAVVPFQRMGNIGRAGLARAGIKRLFVRSPQGGALCLVLKLCGEPPVTKGRSAVGRMAARDELSEDDCAAVVYGETGTLRAPGGDEDQLVTGRTFIAAVAYARYLDDPSRFAPKKRPTDDELQDAGIKKHWDLCIAAAKAGKQLGIGNCLHFVVWPIDSAGVGPTDSPTIPDAWPYQEVAKITERYGPFKSYSKPLSDATYIFKYCGVRV